ncbi:MAG: hypothetical protein EXQ52_13270 [Bryobacterales bacterium]|nr:hypothetical protein [Bryobacterales bacterium]
MRGGIAISNNWAVEPLPGIEKLLKFIGTTKTEPGLVVKSYLIDEYYETGIKISDAEMAEIRLATHETFGKWNFRK